MVDDVRVHWIPTESEVVEVGSVVQMPAKPKGRAIRPAVGRETETARVSSSATTAAKPGRVRRPEPVDDELGVDDPDQLRALESSVRVTIIGPDGQPRTKIVRLSGSRDGTTAPARRPHD